jgi:hypothetical protein
MLKLDHISVIAPSLAEGVSHVRACLDLDVPFGQRHAYMGTYNHLLQLGDTVYLEIVALDPEADGPGRARWFGLGACPNSGCSILSESDSTLGYEQVFSALEYRSDAASAAECAGLRAERPCLAVYR